MSSSCERTNSFRSTSVQGWLWGAIWALLLGAINGYAAEPAIPAVPASDEAQQADALDAQVKRLYQAGRYAKAIPLAEQALRIREATLGPEHPDTATSLNNLALLYDTTGAYAKAEELYQRALAIREKALGPEHPSTATSLNNLALLYHATGAYAKAEPLYQRALAIAASTKAPELLATVFGNLSGLGNKQQQPLSAIFYGKQAVNVIQGMRAGMQSMDPALRESYVKKNTFVYRDLADLLIGEGRFPEAQQVLAMLKEEEYFEFVRRDSDTVKRDKRASYSAAEQPWEERYQAIASELVSKGEELRVLERKKSEMRTPEEQARIKQLRSDLDIAQRRFTAFLEEMRIAFEKLARERGTELAARQFDTSRMGLVKELGEGTVLLQYIVLEDGVRILLTTSTVQKAYRVPTSDKALKKSAFDLQAALRDPRQDPRPAAKALYDVLIGPVAEDLKQAHAKTLMVSLDSVLRYIPTAALYDGKRYLAEQYAINVVTEAAADKMTQTPGRWKVAGFGLTKAYPGFKALTGTKAELDSLVKTKSNPGGLLEGKPYLDEAFTKDALQESLSDHYALLHVASHFQFVPGTEKDSFLLLGDGSRLDLAELRQGRYDFKDVDLLTLSACETALGGGEGKEVEGMAVTAQKKGAKAVLATLWPVADRTTAVLMQRMYDLRENAKLSKAEALRRAQIELLNGQIGPKTNPNPAALEKKASKENEPRFVADPTKPYAHPYYWAPFILMGNWL